MNKGIKRILALFLTLCTVFGLMVPMAFAAATSKTISFTSAAKGTDWDIVKNATGKDIAVDSTTTGYYTNTNGFVVGFNGAYDGEVGGTVQSRRWIAVKVSGITAGTYHAESVGLGLGNGGLTKLYVLNMDSDGFNAVYDATIEDTDYQQKDPIKLLPAATGNLLTALEDSTIKVAQIDSYKSASWVSNDIGAITFPRDGEYVLLFQCYTSSSKANAAQFAIKTLTLTPAVATVGNEAYTTAASAVAAIAGAAEDTNVTINSDLSLSADLTTAANIIVARSATLDLAGKTLTAGEINIAGALVDTAGDGLLVTANDITCTSNNGGYLPLKTASGYKLFKVNTQALGIVEVNATTNAYWFHADFEKSVAYDYYADVKIGAQMTWEGGSNPAWADSTFMGNWATLVKADKERDIKVTVTGLDTVTNFKLTPVIQANGVTISMDTLG